MKINEILSEQEKLEIKKFTENKRMLEAIKKVLLAGIYENGTLEMAKNPDYKRNFALNLVYDQRGGEINQNNELLGQRLRACAEALRFLECGFEHLESLNVEKVTLKEVVNQAR